MKNYFIKILKTFICLFLIDTIFTIISFGLNNPMSFLRFGLFDLALSILLETIMIFLKDTIKRIISIIFISFFSIYALVELQFKNFVGSFYSFQAVSKGFGGISQYSFYFISSIKIHYLLVLIPIVLIIGLNFKKKEEIKIKKIVLLNISLSILLSFISFGSINYSNDETLIDSYKYHNNHEYLLSSISVIPFFFDDILCTINPPEVKIDIEIEEHEEEIIEEEEKTRYFDDSKLVSDSRLDSTLSTIDKYILNKPIEQPNEMTGVFEGYNLIYVLVESLDYLAIDKDLTPTLYKMYTQGYGFNNHYTPEYSCGTGDSEYVSMTGQFPLVSVCSLYSINNQNLDTSIANLFKNAGYDTYGFHNWNDNFYPRSTLSKSYGIDTYMDFNNLGITALNGWLSDEELFDSATPYILESDKFFAYYVTCAMHWPYDTSSDLGDRYLDKINEVHPDYPLDVKRYLSKSMDFDKGLESLLKQLEESGKLDNTVICLFADHHPYKFNNSVFSTYQSLVDRTGDYGRDKEPFIMYCASAQRVVTNQYCSTIDHVPTIANLFNLNYDPRLYVGNDIFNNDCIIKFSSGSWISNKGLYNVYSNSFVPYVDNIEDDYIEKTKKQVSNAIKISQAMLQNDYFSERDYLANPKCKER